MYAMTIMMPRISRKARAVVLFAAWSPIFGKTQLAELKRGYGGDQRGRERMPRVLEDLAR